MRNLRLVLVAAALTASSLALPAYAAGPGGGGGGGGGGAAVSFKTFRMAGALYSTSTPAVLTGGMQYTLDPTGRTKLVVGYLNRADLPAGTELAVLADGVQIGTLVTTAQGGALSIDAGAPRLTLQSQISLVATSTATTVASGAFTRGI